MRKDVLLALVAVFALAACDNEKSPPPAGDPPTKERPFVDPKRR